MERYESLNYDAGSYETTDYHGGMHYLEKGDSITVAIQNPCPSHVCSVQVYRSAKEKSNYFGAFLVTPYVAKT